jgi:asparagine synthase (glutamine-hydrolysing)
MSGRVRLELGPRWHRSGGSWVRGHGTVDGRPMDGQEFAEWVDARSLATVVAAIDGGFSAIQERNGRIVAAVDRLRSVPLFHAVHGGDLLLSDDAHWIAGQLPPQAFDPVSRAEFLALGYVTGSHTLDARIRQLRAAELLETAIEDVADLVTRRYWTYAHRAPSFTADVDELLVAWDAVLGRVASRLVESVDGRTIVLPLSGGLDSRLIALELKRTGYDRVLTFTYGVAGNAEARVAQPIAAALGLPWIEVVHTLAAWRAAFRDPAYGEFARYADGLSSLPHIQDWLAVRELRDRDLVPPDAVFVPGHNGGFLFGENGSLHRLAQPTFDDLVANIERVHYHNLPVDDPALRAAMRDRLVASLAPGSPADAESWTSRYERWEWEERNAKFMTNSVRVYEFWGYDWRLPLWDAEAIEFWLRVPLELRARAVLHRTAVARAMAREGVPEPATDRFGALRNAVMRDYVPARAKRVGHWVRGRRWRHAYRSHPMAWYGIIEPEQFAQIFTGTETINSILALHHLGLLPPAVGEAHHEVKPDAPG